MTKNNRLMCFAEVTAVCSENGMASLNTLCWQNAVFPNDTESGTWRYHSPTVIHHAVLLMKQGLFFFLRNAKLCDVACNK